MRKVVIIGSGPAGLTAAIYTARAGLEPLVLEGVQPGGQLTTTTEIENFPGFPEGIQGPELMDRMREQAQRFGAQCEFRSATRVDLSKRPFLVEIDGDETVEAATVILATGASAQYLGLDSETRLRGHGVSACATCDGFFFRGKEVAVVGGGDTALEEASFLTHFATKVTVIHRRDKLRGSKPMQDRAMANPKIAFLWDSVVEEVLDEGTGAVTGLRVRNVKTDAVSVLPVQGMFLGIGHLPNTQFLGDQVELDPKGYVVTKRHTETSVPGVFACGDVVDTRYRQAITAAGTGCAAAIDAERFLEEHGG
ncbi:MAG TPA: thioredoxin-disulfide reductase [Myxococcota bacterium]|jgi:thioredoxin reductase (NADPH)|nr:thioredoxin-disulfide reductase [Myxococcota bacterium]